MRLSASNSYILKFHLTSIFLQLKWRYESLSIKIQGDL